MPTTTLNLGLTLPTPNVDTGWGSTLNTDFTTIDNVFAAAGSGPSVGLNVGSGKTLNVGGTLVGSGIIILGSGDGTGTVAAPVIRGAARTGSNVAGANLTIDASNGTGTGGSGQIIFRTAAAGASGSTPNTMATALALLPNGYAYAQTASAYQNDTAVATTAQVYSTVTKVPIQTIASNYTLTLTETGALVRSNTGSAITITVPTTASVPYADGTRIDLLRWGTGTVTISPQGGVYILSSGNKFSLASHGSGATLVKISGDNWALIGDLA